MVTRHNIEDHPFRDINQEARSLTTHNWTVSFEWHYRNFAKRTDELAKVSHRLPNSFSTFDQPPPWLTELKFDDRNAPYM